MKDDAEICIPQSWKLVNLSNISIIQEGAGIRTYQYRSEGIHLLTETNILDGSIDPNISKKYINYEEFLSKYKHLKLKKGDIVTACSGGSWGKCAIFNLDEEFMLNTSTLRLRFFGDEGDNNYLYMLAKSAFFKNQLLKQLSGMQPNFGYSHYKKIIVPLPPLMEQQRIVAKLKKIFYQFC